MSRTAKITSVVVLALIAGAIAYLVLRPGPGPAPAPSRVLPSSIEGRDREAPGRDDAAEPRSLPEEPRSKSAGRWTITGRAMRRAGDIERGEILPAEPAPGARVKLQETLWRPVQGAEVIVEGGDHEEFAESDGNGVFDVGPLPQGKYGISAEQEGFRPWRGGDEDDEAEGLRSSIFPGAPPAPSPSVQD